MILPVLPLSRVYLAVRADQFPGAVPLARSQLACIDRAIYVLEGPLPMLFVVEELALIVGKRVLEDVPPEASEGAVSEPAHEDRPIVGVGRDHADTFTALGRLVVF